ncbi:unnamed protein product [Linum tenue]|uniref:Uncharacterized protein n=1 Tax=Linum tenue TaxID=586396 RepID=A0AAV0J1Q6_9ROSI|nr:unnamed protein product [Linum tenue]
MKGLSSSLSLSFLHLDLQAKLASLKAKPAAANRPQSQIVTSSRNE